MTEYHTPPPEDVKRDFESQKDRKKLLFAKRGMNDNSFHFLSNLILSEPNAIFKQLDIRHNCLTNKSLPLIKKLHDAGLTLKCNDNYFKEIKDSESPLERHLTSDVSIFPPINLNAVIHTRDAETNTRLKILEEQSIRTQKQVNETSETVKETSETVKETSKTVKETSKTMKETIKTMNETIKTVNETSKAVRALTASVKQNTDCFDKAYKQIESSISRMICDRFPEFVPVKKEDLGDCALKNHETDILLLSKDGTVLIIGEVKYDIVPYAFVQLTKRKVAFYNSEEDRPPLLKNVKEVVGVIGGDIFRDDMRKWAKKEGYIIVSKRDNYIIENEDLLKEYILSAKEACQESLDTVNATH